MLQRYDETYHLIQRINFKEILIYFQIMVIFFYIDSAMLK